MFKGAKLSHDWRATKSWFECSSFQQPRKKRHSHFDVDIELLSNCMDMNVLSQMEGTHFFRLMHSTKLWRLNRPLANLEGQLHAQDRLEGGENQF